MNIQIAHILTNHKSSHIFMYMTTEKYIPFYSGTRNILKTHKRKALMHAHIQRLRQWAFQVQKIPLSSPLLQQGDHLRRLYFPLTIKGTKRDGWAGSAGQLQFRNDFGEDGVGKTSDIEFYSVFKRPCVKIGYKIIVLADKMSYSIEWVWKGDITFIETKIVWTEHTNWNYRIRNIAEKSIRCIWKEK